MVILLALGRQAIEYFRLCSMITDAWFVTDLSQAKYLILTTVQNETRQGVLMGDVTSLREKLEELEKQG